MKRLAQAVLGMGLAVSVVACAGDNANERDKPAAREPGAAVGTAGANADRDFIQDQLEDGRAEVNLAKIASERATHPQVKEFAQMMAMTVDSSSRPAAAFSPGFIDLRSRPNRVGKE